MNKIKLVIITLALTVAMIGISSSVIAVEVQNNPETPTTNTVNQESRTTVTTRESDSGTTAKAQRSSTATTEKPKTAIAKLEATKLKVCQNRETEIKDTLARMADRGAKRIDTFSEIATRVEAFYTTKGKILANYDTLVAKVDSTKAIAETAIKNLSASSTTFSCTSEDPKGIVTEFKTNNQTLNSVLKNYQTAIKNLIVGVKSVQSTTTSDSNKTTTTQTTSGEQQ